MIERKTVLLEVKAPESGDDAGTFEGYASIFGNVDLGGDVIQKGAFRKSVKAQKGQVPLFWRHDQPIGMATVQEDEKGLHTLGFPLVNDVQLAREGMALVKAGAVRAMSIGYVPLNAPRDTKTGIRTIKEADLLEVSLVPFGMNPAAGVTAVKALREAFENLDELTAALIEGRALAPDFAKALALSAFPAVQSDTTEAAAVLHALKETLTWTS